MDGSLTQVRHQRSQKDFPSLKLDDDEYVEFAFKRAKICLVMIIGAVFVALAIILLAFLLVLLGQSMLDDMGRHFVFIILSTLIIAAVLTGVIALMIYHGNRLYITNKHVIQQVMDSPTSHSVNMIELSSVEDASYHCGGVLQTIFNYGTLRLATVGDETTYTFKYSDISSDDLKAVTKLITDAKKRPRPHTDDQPDDAPAEPESAPSADDKK